MRNIIFVVVSLFGFAVCRTQYPTVKNKADSLSYVSRAKADLVLSHFDNVRTAKILYSISDEQYYVVLKDECCYKEYYIHADSAGNVIEQRLVKSTKQNTRLLQKAFNVRNYLTKFVTKADKPSVVEGNPSYFVLKDIAGKRYGEYSLSVITSPIPIDRQLYSYLLTRLLKESSINGKRQ